MYFHTQSKLSWKRCGHWFQTLKDLNINYWRFNDDIIRDHTFQAPNLCHQNLWITGIEWQSWLVTFSEPSMIFFGKRFFCNQWSNKIIWSVQIDLFFSNIMWAWPYRILRSSWHWRRRKRKFPGLTDFIDDLRKWIWSPWYKKTCYKRC